MREFECGIYIHWRGASALRMHVNIFTSVVCMNDYIITIQTFTNLEEGERGRELLILIVPPDSLSCI